jgi:hypothetical protein
MRLEEMQRVIQMGYSDLPGYSVDRIPNDYVRTHHVHVHIGIGSGLLLGVDILYSRTAFTMAALIQDLALYVQNTMIHLQFASDSLTALVAVPFLMALPQWMLDMQHEQKWDSHIIKILLHNSDIFQRKQ